MNSVKSRPPLGQHFLTDTQVIEKIITIINPEPNIPMVEIGPGRGALTDRLLDCLPELHVIEIDKHLVENLNAHSSNGGLIIHHCDALKFDYSSIHNYSSQIRVVGNLPYSISTQLILKLAEISEWIKDICFMVQKEVAERLAATCGTRSYGRLTVSVCREMTIEKIFDVPPASFTPPPAVESSIVYMKPKPARQVDKECSEVFSELVRTAFGSRRKKVRNSLAMLANDELFRKAGIDSGQRAENLTVEQYETLAKAICTV